MQKKKTLSCLQDNVFLIVFQWPLVKWGPSTFLWGFRVRSVQSMVSRLIYACLNEL